ncbi:MAG: hypothetical protein HY332_15770 [Chloroflexi bacterium]|nr:hypothetical protein [Chloroflexota bacterium]
MDVQNAQNAKNAQDTPNGQEGQLQPVRVPLGQVVFDEIFLWFFLSLTISMVIYNIWGLMDLLRTPVVAP